MLLRDERLRTHVEEASSDVIEMSPVDADHVTTHLLNPDDVRLFQLITLPFSLL